MAVLSICIRLLQARWSIIWTHAHTMGSNDMLTCYCTVQRLDSVLGWSHLQALLLHAAMGCM